MTAIERLEQMLDEKDEKIEELSVKLNDAERELGQDWTYRGRHSVRQVGDRVWIDGLLVGVECDCDGDPIATPAPLPAARVARSWRASR